MPPPRAPATARVLGVLRRPEVSGPLPPEPVPIAIAAPTAAPTEPGAELPTGLARPWGSGRRSWEEGAGPPLDTMAAPINVAGPTPRPATRPHGLPAAQTGRLRVHRGAEPCRRAVHAVAAAILIARAAPPHAVDRLYASTVATGPNGLRRAPARRHGSPPLRQWPLAAPATSACSTAHTARAELP